MAERAVPSSLIMEMQDGGGGHVEFPKSEHLRIENISSKNGGQNRQMHRDAYCTGCTTKDINRP